MTLSEDDEILNEINDTNNEKIMLNYKTSLAKTQFIDEIKSGLGEEIKKSGNKVEVIKPSIWKRIRLIIKKLFTGF